MDSTTRGTAAPTSKTVQHLSPSFTSGWPRTHTTSLTVDDNAGTEPKEPDIFAGVGAAPSRHSRLYVPDHAFGPGSSGGGCPPPVSLSLSLQCSAWQQRPRNLFIYGPAHEIANSTSCLADVHHDGSHQGSPSKIPCPSSPGFLKGFRAPLTPLPQNSPELAIGSKKVKNGGVDPGYSCRKLRRILPKTTTLDQLQLPTGIQLSHHRFFLPISALDCGLNANFLPSGS